MTWTPPPLRPVPPPVLPGVQRMVVAGGVPVLIHRDHRVPMVRVVIQIRMGRADAPSGLWGLADLATEMMMESAGDLDAVAFARRLEFFGGSLRMDCDLLHST